MATLVLVQMGPTFHVEAWYLFPGETEVTGSVALTSEIEGSTRTFEIVVDPKIAREGPQQAWWRVRGRELALTKVEGDRAAGHWRFRFDVPDSLSWAVNFTLSGPAFENVDGPADSTRRLYVVPLASHVSLTEKEQQALAAAKKEIAAEAGRRAEQEAFLRFLTEFRGVSELVGEEPNGDFRVRFTDGSYVVVPRRRTTN